MKSQTIRKKPRLKLAASFKPVGDQPFGTCATTDCLCASTVNMKRSKDGPVHPHTLVSAAEESDGGRKVDGGGLREGLTAKT